MQSEQGLNANEQVGGLPPARYRGTQMLYVCPARSAHSCPSESSRLSRTHGRSAAEADSSAPPLPCRGVDAASPEEHT
ncbi:hypothetical protein SKAU_G00314980 [Synaphobranchus kaupii]|uniref:Uncharacterized protein n=1 Tax=Synaphobranchus kaupii TaxID=118154 RepID=A0A9Q1IJI4_SYNKA|nr:hypothetical protein SKAU_G00314980 [Synaphobranchus kaupii]